MEYQELKCRNCGGPIRFGSGVTRIQCGYCGTEYMLSAAAGEGGESVQKFEYKGRGMLFRSFVPRGWDGRVVNDQQSFSWQAAVCMGLQLDSPRGEQLLFYPFAYFKDFTPGSLGLRKNYGLDPANLIRYRQRPGAEAYARERMGELFAGLEQLTLQSVPDKDGILRRRTERFLGDAAKQIKKTLTGETSKYRCRFLLNGVPCSGYFASGSVFAKEEPAPAPQPKAQERKSGGGLLDKALNYKGLFGGPSINDLRQSGGGSLGEGLLKGLGSVLSGHNWGRAFDFVMVAPNSCGEAEEGLFDRFCENLGYGSLYFALQDEEMEQVRQIQLQGAQQRQQNAINAQRQLHRTQSQTTDTINSGYWERTRRMDDVRQRYSEAVRGVNTYANSYGDRVEADVKYEHVYQRGDDYVGSTDSGVNLGPEWQELKRER